MNLVTIVLLSFGVFSLELSAETLIIPEENVSFQNYRENCEKNSYLCTDRYFIDFFNQSETLQFDELVNSIDLTSKDYIRTITKKLSSILQSEVLSIEQLEMCLRLISQVEELVDNKSQLSLIEADLKLIKNFLSKTTAHLPTESFFIIFKTPVSENDFKSLKGLLIKFPVVQLHFASVPLIGHTLNFKWASNSEPLLKGRCEKAQLSKGVAISKWQPLALEMCSLTREFSRVSTSVAKSISENKKWYITGAVLLGAAVLLNKYEVQFQF